MKDLERSWKCFPLHGGFASWPPVYWLPLSSLRVHLHGGVRRKGPEVSRNSTDDLTMNSDEPSIVPLAFGTSNVGIFVVWTERRSETDVCLYVDMHMGTIEILHFLRHGDGIHCPIGVNWSYTFQDSLRRPLWQESSETVRSELHVTSRDNVGELLGFWWFLMVSDGFWWFLHFSLLEARFWRALGNLAMKADLQRYPKYPAGHPLKKEQWDRQKLTISKAMLANSSGVKYCKFSWMRNDENMLVAVVCFYDRYRMCFLDLWPNMVSVWRDLVDSYLVEMAPE